jgi:flagellar basal body-associated protein FliL
MGRVGNVVLGATVGLGMVALATAPARAPETASRPRPAAGAPALLPTDPPAVCRLPDQETTLVGGDRRRSVRFTVSLAFADPAACERAAPSLAAVAREAAAVVGALTAEEALSNDGKDLAKAAIARRAEALLGAPARVTAVYYTQWVVAEHSAGAGPAPLPSGGVALPECTVVPDTPGIAPAGPLLPGQAPACRALPMAIDRTPKGSAPPPAP